MESTKILCHYFEVRTIELLLSCEHIGKGLGTVNLS